MTTTAELPHEEAFRLVHGARKGDYGHPLDNFTATAKMFTGTLFYKLRPGVEITAEEIALLMTQVKIAREINSSKRDNLTDAHGYLMTYDMVKEERARRFEDTAQIIKIRSN